MATIEDLPSELLSEILLGSLQQTTQIRSRYLLLKTLALVNHNFCGCAQRLLWRDVYLYHDAVAAAFLSSDPAGAQRHRVEELRIFGDLQWMGVTNVTAREVVGQARGVDALALWYFEGLDSTLLEVASLSSLKSLVLSTDIIPLPLHRAPLQLPFQLRSLSLSNYHIPANLLAALFRSSADTIRVLNLSSYGGAGGTVDSALLEAFPIVTAHLRELHLPPNTNVDFLPHLAHCTALTHLTILSTHSENLLDTLLALPPCGTLVHLSTRVPEGTTASRLEFILRLVGVNNFPALSKLERMEILTGSSARMAEGGIVRPDHYDHVLAICAQRGITLVLNR